MGIKVLFVFIISFLTYLPITSAEVTLKAAFIRDHQLWMIDNGQEYQLTTGRYVYDPKWSFDGRFIAYLDGDKNGEKMYLFVYDTKQKKNYQPYPTAETRNFQWSPSSNQLAYNSFGVLNVTKTENGIPKGFENVSLGVSDFGWFPDGKSFIVSSQANLLPTGWGPVHLFKVPVDAQLDTTKIKPFYTIKTNTSDLFAVDANLFKWSSDQSWLSFLATPTASWSADSNTLCVLSASGTNFQPVGQMLIYEDWIQWAPSENKLAYISGEGRFFVQNKKSVIADIPAAANQKEYTPAGYVDLDIEWLSKDEVIVSRAKENKEWEEGPVPEMNTSLYVVNIRSGNQKQLTYPNKHEADTNPQFVHPYITWIRKGSNGEVWIKEGIHAPEKLWLENVDGDLTFYKKTDIY
ncbi:translocation protein TolB [Metabacillus idriensis]|uniref:translocation protein TolB n=1 Tax=Metabacillus idriensis TaxID=324768 RepID=UPI003D2BE225